jgi:hypothetical protein
MLSILFLLAAANVKISMTEAKPSVPPRALVAPRTTPLDAMAHGVVRLLPAETVIQAADAAPAPVFGVFDLSVLRADMGRRSLYLNSETDYRDQRT